MSRERLPPRGPKGMHDPPSGPRAGYAPDFRGGSRGRGRGRGFRDESRDRGRDLERDRNFSTDYHHRDERGGRFRDERSRERDQDRERDFRNTGPDRRDSRGRGGGNSYRGERSRDRGGWRDREPFHNRNASPQLRRSRSPDMRASRDPRDGHLNLDLDRTHRGPRDGPLSAGSSSSDPSAVNPSQINRGGYGRGRGYARGHWDQDHRGGRARYDDRFRGRSRSQERDSRDLVRGRGDIRISRDERVHRDDRANESRPINERKLSSWDSPVPSARGRSPSSTIDDSRREEGEIKREPRTENTARRKTNPDFNGRGGMISSERFANRPTSQSPPTVTLVPAFGSLPGRPQAPSVPIQGPAISKPTPITSTVIATASGSVSERPSPITPTAPGSMTGRAPPTAPKADRSKYSLDSPNSSMKDARPSPRTGSNAVFPQPIRKEIQDPPALSNIESSQPRYAGSAPSTSRLASFPNVSDRFLPGAQTFAGQKHARSDSEPEATSTVFSSTSMQAPSIPTEPRADRAKKTSSPSNASKMRYNSVQKAPIPEQLLSPKARDTGNVDLEHNQSNSTGKAPSTGSTPTTELRSPDLPESDGRAHDRRKSLKKELLKVKARKTLKQYTPAFNASKIGNEGSVPKINSAFITSTKSSSEPALIRRPLEFDSRIFFEDNNVSDSDSADEDELDEDYFEVQNRKLTAELEEVEKNAKSLRQPFPPCDLAIDDLAFAEIQESDITIISDASSKQASLVPIAMHSPRPIENVSPILSTGPSSIPKPETVDVPNASPEPPTATLAIFPTSQGETTTAATAAADEGTSEAESPAQNLDGKRTPSPSRLTIIPDAFPFHRDSVWLKSVEIPERIRQGVKDKMRVTKQLEQEDLRKEKAEYSNNYRIYLQMVQDFEAENPHKSTTKADLLAAKDMKRAPAAVLSIEARPEGGRSTRNSHQSQLELEAVLRASEQEAQDLQRKFDNKAQSKPNYATEAVIPDQLTARKHEQTKYFDKTGLVPFQDAIDVFGFGEFRTDFSPEERKIFEKAYKKTPKQWGIIAEALDSRDFHDCIAHYYSVKGDASWPFKARKIKSGKTRAASRQKLKTTSLVAVDPDDDQNDRQGRRVTRAAAAGENGPSESDTNTPVPASGKRAPTPNKTAPTPIKGRALTPAPPKKTPVSSKPDPSAPAPPPEKRPRKPSTRNVGGKKAKIIQAAAAPVLTPIRGDEEGTLRNDMRRPGGGGESAEQRSFAPPFEGQTDMKANFQDFLSHEQPVPPVGFPIGMTSQPYLPHDNSVMMQHTPTFDSQQERRALQATSSYWSVPEQNDFPALLKSFGTDWGEIAKFMTSKTHIMVFTTKFREWLTMPSKLEQSRLVANVQAQVKNYYQRQVESGKRDYEQYATEADLKKSQGKKLDPPPTLSVPPKRPYNAGVTQQTPALSSEAFDDLPFKMQPGVVRTASPAQPTLSSRFPTLAQAGPVPQNTSDTNHAPHKQVPPYSRPPQQMQQRPFVSPRGGPSMPYFSTADRERPILSAPATPQAQPFVSTTEHTSTVISQAARAAQEAEREKAQALRIEKVQEQERVAREKERQMQERERRERQDFVQERIQVQERQLKMKQESLSEPQNLHQYEPYPTYLQQPILVAPARVESRIASPASDTRRNLPQQPFGRNSVLNLISESVPTSPLTSHTSPNLAATTRTSLGATTNIPQQYSSPATPVQPPAVPARSQEPTRSINIRSLLNDEPSDPRPAPPSKRINEVASSTMPRSQSPVHHQQAYQPSRIQTTQSSLRRESEILSSSQTYGPHNPGSAQASMRLADSPYSAPAQSRSQMASPMDSSPAAERDYFRQQQQQQYSLPHQSQLSGPTPQPGAPFQNQQNHHTNHRQLAFGQTTQQRTASPPSAQYSSQIHRNNSYDSRQGPPPTSISPQQAFGSGHQHQGSPMPVHHQHAHQHPLQNSRFGGPQPQIQHLPHSRTPSHYGQNPQHVMQQSAQSAGSIRSFTPSAYDSRPYPMSSPAPVQQQQQQQQPLSHEPQNSMYRRQMQQQQEQQLRQHEVGYDNGYSRRMGESYDHYDDRRDDRRMDEARR